jgi:tRNA-modifying protein YgfZ
MGDVIRVNGPQAIEYLQGQLSQDVAALAIGDGKPSFLLEPNGKVCAWLQVRRTADDTVELEVDAGFGDTVVERLNRFKLRTKATVEAAGTRPDDRSEAERIAARVPRMGAELVPGRTIPAEMGPPIIDTSVSFTKGCYTGQELVARIDARGGHVPRLLRGLIVEGADRPPPGASIIVEDHDVGTVTSVAWSDSEDAVIALGIVARSVEPPTVATLVWDAGGQTSARIVEA